MYHYDSFSGGVKLVAQKTPFTCGPASLSSVSKLYGMSVDELDLGFFLEAKPTIGTCHEKMHRWTLQNLPVSSSGCGIYAGGLAIANIRRFETGTGHYVVLLGENKGYLRFFCPVLGHAVTIRKDKLCWTSSDGSLKEWCINFHTDRNFFEESISFNSRKCENEDPY